MANLTYTGIRHGKALPPPPRGCAYVNPPTEWKAGDRCFSCPGPLSLSAILSEFNRFDEYNTPFHEQGYAATFNVRSDYVVWREVLAREYTIDGTLAKAPRGWMFVTDFDAITDGDCYRMSHLTLATLVSKEPRLLHQIIGPDRPYYYGRETYGVSHLASRWVGCDLPSGVHSITPEDARVGDFFNNGSWVRLNTRHELDCARLAPHTLIRLDRHQRCLCDAHVVRVDHVTDDHVYYRDTGGIRTPACLADAVDL